jgi:transcriptional regulator with PAS, ATPase and Fis domain
MLPLEQVEANHIRRVLEATGGNKSRTARILGISRQSLLDRLKRFAAQDRSTSHAMQIQ